MSQGRRRGPGQGRGGRAAAGRRSQAPRSRGAGRTGGVRAPGESRPKRDKGLGGEQIEGRQAVRELLIAGNRRVHEIMMSTDLEGDPAVEDIEAMAHSARVPIAYAARKKIDVAARSEAPQGVIAFAEGLREASLDAVLKRRGGRPPFIVAVDGVTDPGNLGAIIRNCDGAGVDLVVLPRHRAVHVTPTVAKSAAGAIEHVPMTVVPGLPNALQKMKNAGVWVIGLDDAADKTLFEIADLAVEPVCVVLGAEGPGVSRLVKERCDMVVAIPMLGRVSSLNVAAAAALTTYEVARHRQA